MRALLKTGQWVDIDTNCLFDNQYNTTEECGNKRIFDGDIKRIEGDVRLGLGKCKYCGAIVKRGEEEKHFAEKESKGCVGCFWYRDKIVSEEKPERISEDTIVELPDGTHQKTTRTTVTKTTVYEKACTYNDESYIYQNRADCSHKECRAYGIHWFTPENTYFLKYPNGLADFTIKDLLRNGWNQRWADCYTRYVYNGNFGSYILKLNLEMDEKTIHNFELENARYRAVFTYDPNEDLYVVYDGINGSPRTVKKILQEGTTSYGRSYPKCNETINKQVYKVIKSLYESVEKIANAD